MPPELTIAELTEDADFRRAFPLMCELYLELDEAAYQAQIAALRAEGYRVFALYRDGEMIALAGFNILHDLYLRKHVWLRDLITTYEERSKGYGAHLLAFVEDFARRAGCQKIALPSGLHREGAHQFYETYHGYRRLAYVFEKALR